MKNFSNETENKKLRNKRRNVKKCWCIAGLPIIIPVVDYTGMILLDGVKGYTWLETHCIYLFSGFMLWDILIGSLFVCFIMATVIKEEGIKAFIKEIVGNLLFIPTKILKKFFIKLPKKVLELIRS